ncbi:MAG: SDR family oxidoreductase [Actinomycetota bacterium]|nr:SDR family oxidoreductase [Actinomycetota bacterium]
MVAAGCSHGLAAELGPTGTSVNAIAPGATVTALLRLVNDQDAIDAMAATTPLRRVGQPDDISGVVTFLASPAGRWITGQTIYADGGLGLCFGLPNRPRSTSRRRDGEHT